MRKDVGYFLMIISFIYWFVFIVGLLYGQVWGVIGCISSLCSVGGYFLIAPKFEENE